MWGQDYWGSVLVQELTSHVTLSKPFVYAHRLSCLNYKIEDCSEKTNERTQVKGLCRHPEIVQRYYYLLCCCYGGGGSSLKYNNH